MYQKRSNRPNKTSHHLNERPLPLHGEVRAGVLGGGHPHDPQDGNACLAQPHVHRELPIALDELLPKRARQKCRCYTFRRYEELLLGERVHI